MLTAAIGACSRSPRRTRSCERRRTSSSSRRSSPTMEQNIAVSRQVYNDTVLTYDNALETVPTNIVAGLFNFRPRAYFETEGAAREAPAVQFSLSRLAPPSRARSRPRARGRRAAAPSRTRCRTPTSPCRSSRTASLARARADHVRLLGRLQRRLPRHPAAEGESIDDVAVSEGRHEYRPGANTELGGSALPGTFGVETDSTARCGSSGTTGRRRAPDVHDLVPLPRPRRRLRRRRRRQPAGLGRPVAAGLGRLTAAMRFPAAPASPSYRVWGNPAWVRGVVARSRRRDPARARVPAHQFVELRVVFPRSCSRRRAARGRRRRARIDRRRGEPPTQRAYEHDHERIDDAKRHIGRTTPLLLLLGLGPGARVMALVWLRLRPRAQDRLRPRVRAGAAVRHRAGARAAARSARDGRAGSNEFTATLFDLIRRGRYKATPVTTERKIWGGLRHEDVADLELTLGDDTVEMTDFEQPVGEVVDSVVDGEARAALGVPRAGSRATGRRTQALHELQGGRRRRRSRRATGTRSAASPVLVVGIVVFALAAASCSGSAIPAGARPRRAGATSSSSRSACCALVNAVAALRGVAGAALAPADAATASSRRSAGRRSAAT